MQTEVINTYGENMNLKESLRYQNFLSNMMKCATYSIQKTEHCLEQKKIHYKNKANSEAEDIEEIVEIDPFPANDDVISFMFWLIGEKCKLCEAISKAKASIGIDIDASVESNKFRQQAASAIRGMLLKKPSRKVDKGVDHKFNLEGNQSPYFYDIETIFTDIFDREKAKGNLRALNSTSDVCSEAIDTAMVNTIVDYDPVFDVNSSFEDVMEEFILLNKEGK